MTDSRGKRPKPFTAVFRRDDSRNEGQRWRIRGSGVRRYPEDAEWTAAVVKALESSGIEVRRFSYGSPANIDSQHLEAKYLDGRLFAETSNGIGCERGAWVTGCKAVIFTAWKLALSVPQDLRNDLGLEHATLDDLEKELRSETRGPSER
jgi:hypothetical protein